VGLWKRGGVWWAYFYIDGVRRQHTTKTANRRQAELIFDKLKSEAMRSRFQLVEVDPSLTVGELAARFIADGKGLPYSLDRLKQLLPYFAGVPVVRVNRAAVDEYRRRRKAAKKVLCDSTLNKDVGVLKHLLYYAVDQGWLGANPLARVRMARVRRTKRAIVSLEEERVLLAAAPDHLRRLMIFALDTGMRRGEILNQQIEHVDFARRLLQVTHSKTAEGESREIPLTKRVLDQVVEDGRRAGLVFCYQDHGIKDVKTSWATMLRKTQSRHIRFHDLRHTFNTRLMEAGVMQEVRKALMGHSSGERVHATYVHVELPVKRDAIARLEAFLKAGHTPEGGSPVPLSWEDPPQRLLQ